MAARQPSRRRPAPKPANAAPKVRIGFIRSANQQFLALSEKERTGLFAKLIELARNPRLGKPLVGKLTGYVRISLGRLRCVARCSGGAAVVLVIVVAKRAEGSGKDPYELARRALADPKEDIQAALQAHVAAHLESLRKAESVLRRDR